MPPNRALIFTLIVIVTFDPNINMGHLMPISMQTGSFKPISWFVHKLLIGNELVYRQSDRPTDQPTDRHPAKQYTPSSSKGGIINKGLNLARCCLKLSVYFMNVGAIQHWLQSRDIFFLTFKPNATVLHRAFKSWKLFRLHFGSQVTRALCKA